MDSDQQKSINGYYRPTFSSKDETRFKFNTFDELINPLRSDHPFGKSLFQLSSLTICFIFFLFFSILRTVY